MASTPSRQRLSRRASASLALRLASGSLVCKAARDDADDKLSRALQELLQKGTSDERRTGRQACTATGGVLYRGRGGGPGPRLRGGGRRAPDRGSLRASVAGRRYSSNTDWPTWDAGTVLRARPRASLRGDPTGHTRHLRGRGRPDRHPVAEQYYGARERRPRKTTGAPEAQQALERDDAREGSLGAYALPDGGAGARVPHGSLRVRGVRVRGHGAQRRKPCAVLEREVSRAGAPQGVAGGGARDPYRRSGDGPVALGRGTYVRELGRDAEHAVRRGLHRTHRGLGQRNGLLRRTSGDSGTRDLRCSASVRGGEGRRGERGEG